MASNRRRRARRRRMLITAIIIIVIIAAAGFAAARIVIDKLGPTSSRTDYTSFYSLTGEDDLILSYDDQILEKNGVLSGGEAYVPFSMVHAYLNTRFFWDDTEKLLRYTVPEGVVNVSGETADYTVGKTAETAEYPILLLTEDEPCISLSFIQKYTNLRYQIYSEPNRVVISDRWGELPYCDLKQKTELRELGGIKSPILKDLAKGDLVSVIERMETWSKVCTEDGFVGYVPNKTLGNEQGILYESDFEEPEYTHFKENGVVNLAWHQVTNQTANNNIAAVLDTTKGLNVISPTWFYLNDSEGNIASLASADYVSYCHQQGIEVWALVSNLENPDVDTTSVLNVTSNRERLINNLISEAVKYGIDGINVDFEMLEGEAGVGFLQFIRELSLKCEGNELILSVDNYSPTSYNAYYTWDEQAVFADYIILMAYDEHYNGSQEEGSVASIGFVRESVENMLEYVPADQLILGIPFYTRMWQLTRNDAGETEISSEALGMSETESRIADHGATFNWLEDCGQYYAEYEDAGSTYKVWAEEQSSIQEKLEVMRSNDLAGAAFWKLGYEKYMVWDTIVKYLSD